MDLKFLPLSVECTDGPPPDVESLPHPLCAPGFDGYHSNSWPRVDLWGTLPTGQRATVHVHGCFPYFYARPLEEDAEAVRAFSVDPNLLRSICTRTARGLDDMLRNGDGAHGTSDARVRSVTVATLTPFYGYHPEPLPFLRVALYRARDVVRAAKLLLDEGCCKYQGRALRLQPYESHVNAHMKFFADVGAGALRPLALDDVRFRRAPKTARVEGWVSEATVREAGAGYAPTKRRLAAPTLAADDAVEVDVAFARVSAATSVRGDDDDYAVPALRELFDDEAERLEADGHASAEVRRLVAVDPAWRAPDGAAGATPTLGPGTAERQARWAEPLAALRHVPDSPAPAPAPRAGPGPAASPAALARAVSASACAASAAAAALRWRATRLAAIACTSASSPIASRTAFRKSTTVHRRSCFF